MADSFAQTEKHITDTRKEITQQRTDLTQARKDIGTRITPRLSRKESMGYTRLQKAQLKGQTGLAEKQRQSSIRLLNTAETAFNKEVTGLESDFRKTEGQIRSYRTEAAKIAKDNSEWKTAEKLIRKGGRVLSSERRFGSPTLKAKIRKLLEGGSQSVKQMQQNILPKEYIKLASKGYEAARARVHIAGQNAVNKKQLAQRGASVNTIPPELLANLIKNRKKTYGGQVKTIPPELLANLKRTVATDTKKSTNRQKFNELVYRSKDTTQFSQYKPKSEPKQIFNPFALTKTPMFFEEEKKKKRTLIGW